MNIEDFKKTSFGNGDKVEYNGKIYPVVSVDFIELLFAIDDCDNPDHLSWVRCENADFIPWSAT